MKKLILPVLLLLALAALLLGVLLPKLRQAAPGDAPRTEASEPVSAPREASGAELLSDEQQVLARFAQQKQAGSESFALPCGEELFRRLTEDNARPLSLLQIRGGIEDAQVRLREEECMIQYSQVLYTDDPWADCADEEELARAVERLLSEGAVSFRLLCSPELAAELAQNGHVRSYAAAAGFEGAEVSCFTNGVVLVRDPVPFRGAWAPVEDMLGFDAAVEAFSLQEQEEFQIAFSPDFAGKLAEEDALALLHASSCLDRFSREEESVPGLVRYYRVSYSREPALICRSENAITLTVGRMGILEQRSFHVYLVGEELRDKMFDTPLAYIHAVEGYAGLAEGKLSHNDNSIHYTDARYLENRLSPEAASLDAESAAEAFLREKLAAGEGEILLFCSPELYEALLGAPGAYPEDPRCLDPFYALLARCGVTAAELSANRAAGVIDIVPAR